MGRAVGLVEVFGQPPQHGGVAIDRAHRNPAGVGQRGQAVIGAKDIGGAIDEVEMLAIGHENRLAAPGAGVTPSERLVSEIAWHTIANAASQPSHIRHN